MKVKCQVTTNDVKKEATDAFLFLYKLFPNDDIESLAKRYTVAVLMVEFFEEQLKTAGLVTKALIREDK